MTIESIKKEISARARAARKLQGSAALGCEYIQAGVYRGRAEAYEDAHAMLVGMETKKYKIVRVFQSGRRSTTLARGMTEEEAQAFLAQDKENGSSRTCWKTTALARTRKYGAWFECYKEE